MGKPVANRDRREAVIDDVAEEFGVSIQSVRNWVKDKCPHSKIGRRLMFDVAEVAAWRRSRGMDTHNRNAGSSPDIDAARLRKENALADKYEIQVQRERDQLIEVAEVKRLWTNVARVVRNTMQGVGAAVATRYPGGDAGRLQADIDREVADPS